MRRTRTRVNSRTSAAYVWAVLLAGMVVVGVSLPAASVSQGNVPREATVDVATDGNGALTLDVAQSVPVNDTSDLVDVTNRLGQDVTMTVTLRTDSEHVGDLVVDGVDRENETSFVLTRGSSQVVQVDVPDDSSLTDEVVYFHVTASAPGLTANALDREAKVTA